MSNKVKPVLRVSVRRLVEYSLRTGDLAFDFVGAGGDRAVEGTRAHQRVQQSRPEEYTPEVYISHDVQHDDFAVKITGRIDGVFHYPGQVIIDEIKSVTRSLDYYEAEENQDPLHWGQAKVYAYLYALQEGLSQIVVQLTYVHIDSHKTFEPSRQYSFTELEEFFNQLLHRYLHWASTLEKWLMKRDASIKELEFPFNTYRPGQRRMALDVYRAIEQQEQLIVEAPTGIGKTMAVIFPAVKAMGSGLIEKFFFLTAKTTGRIVAQNALDDLRKKGLKLKSLTLTAKDKICFNPESACNGEECQYAKGYFDRINEAVETAFQRDALTREVIEEIAGTYTVCPFELSLDLSIWVDCIICDYNYVFDPRVYLRRFFGDDLEEKKNFSFLVDEAGNMVDRSREMFSAELFKKPLLELRRNVKGEAPGVYRTLGTINTRMVKFKKECEEFGKPLAQEDFPSDLLPHLRRFTSAAEKWLVRGIKTNFRQNLMEMYFDLSWFIKVADAYYEAYSFCMEKVKDDFRIKLYCMDPSQQLTLALERCQSVVFFSATLSPMDYFRHILGCDPSAKQMALPSPFPPENFCLVAANRISTLYKYRERTKMSVARAIQSLVNHGPGNYLVFFPSYQYLKMVYECFVLLSPRVDRIVQTPGMTETQREEFLERFTEDNRSEGNTLVGFAVMGGIFGEGIDLVGDRLNGAVVVGVGLPGISLERELIKQYFDRLQGSGFEYAYLYPGMNRVFQAAGRVIRSGQDRGVVLLIGHRFTTPQYSYLFPSHWQPIPISDDNHLSEVLDRFSNNR